MMMVLSATLPNHSVPVHSHPHEQIGMVYSGKAVLRIGDEERIAKKGDFYCIPANVPHSDVCIGDKPFIMLDIFYPLREDFIQKLNKQNPKYIEPREKPFARPLKDLSLQSDKRNIMKKFRPNSIIF